MAMLLITIAAATVVAMSGHWVGPLVFWVAGLIGLPGRIIVNLRRPMRIIVTLALALVFVGAAQFMSAGPDKSPALTVSALVHMASLFFLALMAAHFYVHREGPMPSLMVLYAVLVMVCAGGNVFAVRILDQVFTALAAGLAVVAAIFCATARRRLDRRRARTAGARNAIAAATLVVGLGAGLLAGSAAYAHQHRIHQVLNLWAALLRTHRSVGFGDQVRLREIGYVKSHDKTAVALRVVADEQPGYLRARAYVVFRGDTWDVPTRWGQSDWERNRWPASGAVKGIPPATEPWRVFVLSRPGVGPWRGMRIHPDEVRTRSLFGPAGTRVLVAPLRRLKTDPADSMTAPGIVKAPHYWSYVPARPARPQLSRQMREACMALPQYLDDRVREAAKRELSHYRTAAEKMDAVEAYFHKNFHYHLGVYIPPGEDPLGYLLEHKPPAHCEMFASAAAAMLRVVGVPTRYVTGFVVTEKNPYGDYWIARNADAHAWVEAWDDARGWVRVEATPPAGVPQSRGWGTFAQVMDVLSFHLNRLIAMIRLDGLKGALLWIADILQRLLNALFTLTGLLVVIGVVVAAVLIASLLRLRALGRERRKRPMTPLRRLLRTVDRRIRKLGVSRRESETLHHFAGRLMRDRPAEPIAAAAAQWYRRYAILLYRGPVHPSDVGHLRREMPRRSQ